MPRCSGCGNEVPANSRFCSICGKALDASPRPATPTGAFPTAPTTPSYAPAASDSGKIAAWIGGGLAVLALIAFLIVRASGVLGAKKTEAPVAAVLNAPPVQAAPAAPPVAPGTPMPDDVAAYLRWLKTFEAARRDLENREMTQLQVVAVQAAKEAATGAQSLGTLDNDPTEVSPATGAKQGGLDFSALDTTVQQWNQVAGIFQAKTPPDACAQLAANYNGALTEGVRQMGSIVTAFRSAMSSLKNSNGQSTPDVMGILTSLEGEKSSHSGSQSVDAAYSNADAALDAVRNRYASVPSDIDAQHFDIKESTGGGGSLGLGL